MFPHSYELSFISLQPPPLSTNLEYNLQSSTEPGYTVKGFDKVDVNIGNGGRNTSWQFYNYKLNVNVWDGELKDNLEIHTTNEMAAKWGRGGGRIGKIGGMGTVDN